MTEKYTYDYPMPSVTADNIILKSGKGTGKGPMVLLVKRKNEPFKDKWAFPGGFIEPTETADQAASRELKEETGIGIPANKLSCVTFLDAPDRDPRNRTFSFVYSSWVDDDVEPTAGDDASEAEFKYFSEMKKEDFAFDHYNVLFWYINRDI